jgi:hypothetical protein
MIRALFGRLLSFLLLFSILCKIPLISSWGEPFTICPPLVIQGAFDVPSEPLPFQSITFHLMYRQVAVRPLVFFENNSMLLIIKG